jgi:hypothetical protein
MAVRTVFAEPIAERVSLRYTTALKKEDGAALAAADLTTLTLTLYALDASQTIINSVNAANILNSGRGAVDVNGVLTITLTPDDNQIIDATKPQEFHVLLIQGTYASGTKATRHELQIEVVNMARVP